MASKCPVCGKNVKLKKDNGGEPSFVYCEEVKQELQNGVFVDVGKCDFKFFFNQKKTLGLSLSILDMKKLLEGGEIVNGKGDRITIDNKLKDHGYRKIDYKEDEDF